jgi:predicted methyltransferase
VKAHLDYLDGVAQKNGINTITTINNHNETLGLDPTQKVDLAFMCSLYHIIYIVYREAAREKFIESIKSALKPNGRLVIVDNSVVDGPDRPYHGPYIAKELIVAQLRHYGFQLTDYYQPLPQRYVLTFMLQRQD